MFPLVFAVLCIANPDCRHPQKRGATEALFGWWSVARNWLLISATEKVGGPRLLLFSIPWWLNPWFFLWGTWETTQPQNHEAPKHQARSKATHVPSSQEFRGEPLCAVLLPRGTKLRDKVRLVGFLMGEEWNDPNMKHPTCGFL